MRGAHLWKRILNEGINTLGQVENEDKVQTDVITAPIIVDSRYGEIAQNGMTEVADQVAFPFERFFVEGSDESPEDPVTNGARWGAFVQWRYIDAEKQQREIAICCMGAGQAFSPVMMGIAHLVLPSDVPGGFNVRYTSPPGHSTGAAVREVVLYVFDVLSLLSCKNVSLKPNDNEPKQVRRAIKRHGGTPDSYRYHTLVVRPPGARSDSPAQDIGIMPRHVCRGHFAEYGPEFNKGLLFGRYSGRFYIPPHLKGNKENGIVEKDYVIPAQ